jgi:carbon-monoxide dehydrogenase iron sulfur subunit
MCAMVCPFDVITYHVSAAAPEKSAVALKCDHCIDRQREGGVLACVEACKVGALVFGELNELVKAARTRYSEGVLRSVAVEGVQAAGEVSPIPVSIDIWRNWGTAVSVLNENGDTIDDAAIEKGV